MTDPTVVHPAAPTDLGVTFASQDQPALSPGTYTLTATQPVSEGATVLGTLSDSLAFTVAAPRFALEPADIAAVHPPPTATGRFDMTLPHVVLEHGGLPWARPLTADPQTPWLALILVTDDDVLPNPDTREPVSGRTVKDLLTPPNHYLAPALDPSPPMGLYGRPCRILDLRADALADVLPKAGELRWLAHVRDVAASRTQTDEFTTGRRAVVATSRFPRMPARRYTAALVSLEGYAGYTFLGGDTAVPEGTRAVRLAALWSWSFTTDPAGGTAVNSDFHALAQQLASASSSENLLRLPHEAGSGDVAQHVAARLAGGFVPVVHRLPTGEHTPAWYRGPFTARPAQPLPAGREPLRSADAALVYLESFGIWDVSYACAYTCGQLLGASHPSLLRALENHRAQGLAAAQRTCRPAGAGGDARSRFQNLVAGNLAQAIDTGLKRRTPGDASAPDTGSPATDPQRTSAARGLAGLERAVHALLTRPTSPGTGAETATGELAEALRTVAEEHADAVAEAFGPPVDWMSRVPFDHLVPHAGMLPEHSARFFHIDAQWMRALLAGVRSVGAVTRLDLYLDGLLDEVLTARGEPRLPVFGGLIRSPLVRYWPELIVEATKSGSPVTTHISRPLPDAMLLLCDARQPDKIIVREPPHGLSMGIDSMSGDGAVNLRRPHGSDIGNPLAAQATGINLCRRGTSARASEVLRITEGTTPLTDRIQSALRIALNDTGYTLTPAGLALQLLNSAGMLQFVPS
ncbi:hypothetical protein [Streptomyces sp. NPDC021096]|uniref:hypothetical protein n=1 Tax=Streptomyces sp. NPDC021096 TaxID=3154792 RepID=UPI0033C2AA53